MRTASYLDPRRRERCTECGTGLDLCQCEDPDALAHDRCTSPPGRFLLEVAREENAISPTNQHLFEDLVKHVGDLGEQLVDHNTRRTPSPDEIRRTLVTIAAVATRLGHAGTDEYAYPET